MLQPRERTLPVFAGEVFDTDEAGRPVQEPAFQPKLARVGDHAAIRLRRDVHLAAALYRRVVDPAYGSRGVLDDPGHGLKLPDGAVEREAVAVLAEALDALDPDHPRLGVAEIPDKGCDLVEGGVDALLDAKRALGFRPHPQPSSSRRSSSMPKWWAISCTTVILICSSSSARVKSRSRGPLKMVILSGSVPWYPAPLWVSGTPS